MTKQIYDAKIAEDYESNGETKTFWHKVGTVFENEGEGFTLIVTPGISVSGRVGIFPRKEKEETTV